MPACKSEKTRGIIDGLLLVSLVLAWVIPAAAAAPDQTHSLIGPFYTNDPEGLVLLPNVQAKKPVAFNLSIGWVDHGRYVHGYSAVTQRQWHVQALRWGPASGCSRMYWMLGGQRKLHVQWQRIRGSRSVVGRMHVNRPTRLVLECDPAWAGYGAVYQVHHTEILGWPRLAHAGLPGFVLKTSMAATQVISAADGKAFAAAAQGGAKSQVVPLGPTTRFAGMVFSLSAGQSLTLAIKLMPCPAGALASADNTLARGWAAYLARRPYASGDWGNFISPISVAANSGVVYVPSLRNVSATVVRSWCLPQGCLFFNWDSFFNAMLLSVNDRGVGPWQVGRQLAGVLHFQLGDGMVCGFSNWADNKMRLPAFTPDRSEPPVAAMCLWQAYERWPSLKLLKSFYEPLVRYHHWWFSISPQTHLPYRDGNRDGLLEWGSTKKRWQFTRLESGMDDSPMYVPGKTRKMPQSHTFNLDDVGLNSLWAADALYLSKIAAALGHKIAAAHYAAECQTISRRINALLWSHKLGMYCNRYWSRGKRHHLLSQRWSPTNFYPMIAKVPDVGRADRMLAVLLNRKYFWGKWVIPTISRNNPAYRYQEYWKGDIWGPTNYLAFQGLLNYAPPAVLHAFARKSVLLFMNNWNKTGVWSENYSATNGLAEHDPHYSWGALLPTIGLQAICNVMPNGKVRLDGTWNMHAKLYNIPILGYRYTIIIQPKLTEMLRHGHAVAQAADKVGFFILPQRQIP
ncbi:MAG: hypothetical protein HKL96_06440 [Phycisphaerales bacterium]|nr:hypothetical protein [Phycisphaerales bacterium]